MAASVFICPLCSLGSIAVKAKTKADRKGMVDLIHRVVIQFSHFFLETSFVDGTDLFQQYHRIPGETAVSGAQLNVCWKLGLLLLTGNGSSDYRRTELVAHVILNDQYGTYAPLFRSHHRAEIGVINFSSFDSHVYHAPPENFGKKVGCLIAAASALSDSLTIFPSNNHQRKALLEFIGRPASSTIILPAQKICSWRWLPVTCGFFKILWFLQNRWLFLLVPIPKESSKFFCVTVVEICR